VGGGGTTYILPPNIGYIGFPLWNYWTFCNFDAKYCQEIEN
jgi:hypothetical protein